MNSQDKGRLQFYFVGLFCILSFLSNSNLAYSRYLWKVKKVNVKSLSHVWLFATPWTVAGQAALSMGFSWQEYWSRLPFPSPGYPPNPGIQPVSPELQADVLTSEPPVFGFVYICAIAALFCSKITDFQGFLFPVNHTYRNGYIK